MMITLLDVARRHIGIGERIGDKDHPWIQWALSLCRQGYDAHDEVPWCAAAVNAWAFVLGLPMTHSVAARSWLTVGTTRPVPTLIDVPTGFEVVVFARTTGLTWPDASVIDAPGHVGVLDHVAEGQVWIVGGNQHDQVSLAAFPVARVLGVRRLTADQ